MNPIRVKKAKGSMLVHNSMLEKDLSRPVDLSRLYSTPKAAQIKKSSVDIPDYMGHDFKPEESRLGRYLAGEDV